MVLRVVQLVKCLDTASRCKDSSEDDKDSTCTNMMEVIVPLVEDKSWEERCSLATKATSLIAVCNPSVFFST